MAHHHTEIPESKPFKMTGNYMKSFVGMIVVGVLLYFGGYGLTKVGGGDDHGGAHGGEHSEEAHDGGEHSDAGRIAHFAQMEEGDHDGDHAGDHDGDKEEGETHSSDGDHGGDEDHSEMAAGAHGGGDHGDGHGGEEHGSAHGAHHSDHLEDGTWRRAYLHEAQTYIYDDDGNIVMADGHPAHDGAHHEPNDMSKFGASLLGGTFWWICVALFGIFFMAVGYLANAGWYISIKRIIEPFYRFLPIGGLLLVAIFFIFGEHVWDWRFYEMNKMDGGEQVLFDGLIDHKAGVLNFVFVVAVGVFLIAVWTLLGHMFRKASLKEEEVGGLENHKKSIRYSATFLPIFALGFCLLCFTWIMSLEPHWFSTIYAVYSFAGLFVSGAMVTSLIAMHLKEKGHLNVFGSEHMHDMGKFIFAFSCFWAYTWLSQFLLIWYANIPEETVYFYDRFQDYYFLFMANFVINFAFPFLALMTRNAKRKHLSLRSAIRVMLVGRFVDVFLLIAPGTLGATWGFGDMLMFAGAFVLIGGVFLIIVFKGLGETTLLAKKHPFFEESVHHSTGV